jgi:hypothetical protein
MPAIIESHADIVPRTFLREAHTLVAGLCALARKRNGDSCLPGTGAGEVLGLAGRHSRSAAEPSAAGDSRSAECSPPAAKYATPAGHECAPAPNNAAPTEGPPAAAHPDPARGCPRPAGAAGASPCGGCAPSGTANAGEPVGPEAATTHRNRPAADVPPATDAHATDATDAHATDVTRASASAGAHRRYIQRRSAHGDYSCGQSNCYPTKHVSQLLTSETPAFASQTRGC